MTQRSVEDLLNDFTTEASPPDPVVAEPARAWSPQQQAIFDHCSLVDSGNLMIQARAGTGKTTTILKAMEYSPGSSLFLAFNKAIADELQTRVPREMSRNVKTLNALGFGQWRSRRPQAELQVGKDYKPTKLQRILAQNWGREHPLVKEYGYTMTRVVSLAKAQAYGLPGSLYPDLTKWGKKPFEDIIDAYQLDVPAEVLPDVSEECRKLFNHSIADLNTLDFDDQIYIPALEGWPYPRFSNAFVDEFQDLNPIQHYVCRQLIDAGARLIGVGDDHQAIYGFRGALSDSMARAQNQFGMTVLPLSVSYRCSRAVIAEAQRYCPDIEAREGAPLGNVWRREEMVEGTDERGEFHFRSDPELFTDELVICRNNAPLFRAILSQIRAKRPCRVLSNFLEGFQGFIRQFKCTSTTALLAKLERWYETERVAAETKGFWGKIQGLEDKYETTKLLCEQYSTTDEILRVVKMLGEGRTGPTFATIHKSKGLESDRVYILGPDLLPAFYAKSPEQLQQEYHLLYVAITRAKTDLGFGVPQMRGRRRDA